MKKVVFLGISIIIGMLVYQKNDEIIIPTDAIRVRIIANSNSTNDLKNKEKLKNEIINDIYNYVQDTGSYTEADNNIKDSINDIKQIISRKTSDFKLNYGSNYFPKKTYKGVIYPEGEYQSLVITLGKGLGDNWWCVLYPPLCLINDNDNTSDVEYRFLVSDILQN